MDLAGKQLPNTDLLFTTLSSGNTDNNGWRDLVMWTEAIRPKVLTTGHVGVGAACSTTRVFGSAVIHGAAAHRWPGFRGRTGRKSATTRIRLTS
jgi:hypothetical protein